YRRTQLHPLLRDMGIHAFDTARYIMDADPVAVTAHGARPEWSAYAHDATVTATFEMSDGSLIGYNGTWNARGLPTYWTSGWRIGAQLGSTTWDGTATPVLVTDEEEATARLPDEVAAESGEEPAPTASSLIEFVSALRES